MDDTNVRETGLGIFRRRPGNGLTGWDLTLPAFLAGDLTHGQCFHYIVGDPGSQHLLVLVPPKGDEIPPKNRRARLYSLGNGSFRLRLRWSIELAEMFLQCYRGQGTPDLLDRLPVVIEREYGHTLRIYPPKRSDLPELGGTGDAGE